MHCVLLVEARRDTAFVSVVIFSCFLSVGFNFGEKDFPFLPIFPPFCYFVPSLEWLDREIFNWMLKVVPECFGFALFSVIGLEKSCHFIDQSNSKQKLIATRSPAFSRASDSFQVPHWLLVTFSLLWLAPETTLLLVLWWSIEKFLYTSQSICYSKILILGLLFLHF